MYMYTWDQHSTAAIPFAHWLNVFSFQMDFLMYKRIERRRGREAEKHKSLLIFITINDLLYPCDFFLHWILIFSYIIIKYKLYYKHFKLLIN